MASEPASLAVLLSTKLRRPRTVGALVSRPRLLDLLGQGLACPLTVVSAPAGYGKSSLVVSWLDQTGVPAAWYSITQQDNSPLLFAAYLGAAVATAYPAAATAMQALLQTPTTPPPERLAEVLLGELASLPGPLVLVLDDYHEITQPEIHAFLAAVIESAPANVHFVVLSRIDPPLKLARLRARRLVLEVRAAQLRFTPAESLELLQQVLGDRATGDIAALCAERTEGWAAGLHLAALSLRDSADVDGFMAHFAYGNVPFIADYLLSEVLDHLPEHEREVLLSMSVLQRFCAPLIDAVIPAGVPGLNGTTILARLRRANLFLIGLDDEGHWFRFHHLFRDLLRIRLQQTATQEAVAAAHLRASRWFEAQSLIDEALQHALAGGDAERAAVLVETYGEALLNTENRPTLERWLTLLPGSVQHRPGLLILKGWLEHWRYRPLALLRLAQAAEDALTVAGAHIPHSTRDAMQGGLDALRAVANLFIGQVELAYALAGNAVVLVSPERGFVRGIADFVMIRTTALLHSPTAAVDLGQEMLRSQSGSSASRSLRILLALCYVYYDQLDLVMLEKTAQRYRSVAEQVGQRISIGWARFVLGFVYYQRNELEAATRFFAAVVEHAYEANLRAVIDATAGLAFTLQAQGRPAEAHLAIEQLRQYLLQGGAVDALPQADALDDAVDLLAGKLVQPGNRPTLPLPVELSLDLWELHSLLRSRAQVRSGVPAHRAEAAATLAAWHDVLARTTVPRRTLEVELQIALLHALTGEHSQALAAVRRAVTLAAPGGALRIFVDTGPELKPYLHELARQGLEPTYISCVLDAYSAAALVMLQAQGGMAAAPAQVGLAQAALGPDALTYRELDVLQLLCQRLSNKEIADLLYISPFTVKRHTSMIYEKLHVNSRRAAVARAHELGLLAASRPPG